MHCTLDLQLYLYVRASSLIRYLWMLNFRNTCLCGNQKTCVYCKRLKGCTCEGAGSCRLCVHEEQLKEMGIEDQNQQVEIQIDRQTDRQKDILLLFMIILLNVCADQKMILKQGKSSIIQYPKFLNTREGLNIGDCKLYWYPKFYKHKGGIGLRTFIKS